jgi:hypothetical protein
MTRNGKIARLPYGIREELNRRLRDGQFGPAVLKWLNELPECKKVLADEFDGKPITKQNLSEWRRGGYEEWVRKEEPRLQVQRLMEKAGDLEKEAGGMAIADRLGTVLAAELAVAAEQLDEIKDPKERWARLKDITRELYRLRREDHHARKLRMAEEQWEIRSKREAREYEQREKESETKKLIELQEAMMDKPLKAALLESKGDGEAWKWVDWEIRVRHGLPMPKWWTNPKTAEEWAELMRPYWWGKSAKSKGQDAGSNPKSIRLRPTSARQEVRGPKPAESHKRDARATKAKRSRRVGAGPTQSNRKSERAKAGKSAEGRESSKLQVPNAKEIPNLKFQSPSRSESKLEAGQSTEENETKKHAEQALGAPMLAENKARPTEFEDDPPLSDYGATRDERPPSELSAPGDEGDAGGNAT